MIYFVSDLHLSESVPALSRRFAQALNDWRGKIEALYILGDLFDYWIGDDDDDYFYCQQIQYLKQFSAISPLYIIRGNRDFLLGEKFAKDSGAILLDDPYCLAYQNRRYILSHGDVLCTDDLAYQQYKMMTHNPAWQANILSKSLPERRELAKQLRLLSSEQQAKTAEIGDVNSKAVELMFKNFSLDGQLPEFLIHGHTHRPSFHQQMLDEIVLRRVVLANWHDDSAFYLKLDASGLTAHEI